MLKMWFGLVTSITLLFAFHPASAFAGLSCSDLVRGVRNEYDFPVDFRPAYIYDLYADYKPAAWPTSPANIKLANTLQTLVTRYKVEIAQERQQLDSYKNQIEQAQFFLNSEYKRIGPLRYQLLRFGILNSATKTRYFKGFTKSQYTIVRNAIVKPLEQLAQAKEALKKLKATKPPSAETYQLIRYVTLDVVKQFFKMYVSGPQNFEDLRIGKVYVSFNDPKVVSTCLETLVYFNGNTYHFIAGFGAGRLDDAWVAVENNKLQLDPNYYSIFFRKILRPARWLMDFDRYDSGPGYDWP